MVLFMGLPMVLTAVIQCWFRGYLPWSFVHKKALLLFCRSVCVVIAGVARKILTHIFNTLT